MLQRHQVTYIVVGGVGRVLQGADEITRGVDIVPSTKGEDLERLDAALRDLNARRPDGREVSFDQSACPSTSRSSSRPTEASSRSSSSPWARGYDDLRKAATREGIGRGVRPSVASIDDLARMLAALGRQEDGRSCKICGAWREMERGLALEL